MDMLIILTILSLTALASGFLIQKTTKDEIKTFFKQIVYTKSFVLFITSILLITIVQEVFLTFILMIFGIFLTVFLNKILWTPNNDAYIRISTLGLVISASYKINSTQILFPMILIFLILQGISTAHRVKKWKKQIIILLGMLLIFIFAGNILLNENNYFILYNSSAGIFLATIVGRLKWSWKGLKLIKISPTKSSKE